MDVNLRITFPFLMMVIMRLCEGIQVYNWQRDWTNGVFTHEFAHVYDQRQQIVHSGSDTSGQADSVASVTFYDYTQGLVAIRPILSNGYQVCFVTMTTSDFQTSLDTLVMRQGTTILEDSAARYTLDTDGSGFESLSMAAVQQFCSVDSEHIFFLTPVDDVAAYSMMMRIQGLFSGYLVGVPTDRMPYFDGSIVSATAGCLILSLAAQALQFLPFSYEK